jgi:ATP-dependent RNA helicase DeaD
MQTFENLGINKDIQRAVIELGFENPMPVQEEVIPLMLNKQQDIIALAQTGTGKTAAFGLPLIQEAVADGKFPEALVLCPTRELCLQIAADLNDYALYSGNIKILPVYGGSNIDSQITALKKGVQILVATPGRLIDLIERRVAILKNIKRVILDEADEMLNMGFLDSINQILAKVPENRNTLLFSATMPDDILNITKRYMNNPLQVTVGRKNAGAENVKHLCYTVHAKDKYLLLKRVVDYNPDIYGIVFCRTRNETQEIADKLIQDGYNADALHGDLSQAMRDIVMQKFRLKNVRLLVATDVAARGIDVNNLTHIINYQLPEDPEVYIHRSGRTARAGKTGVSIIITNLREHYKVRLIEKKINKTFQHPEIPTGRLICEKQLFSLIDRMEKVELDNSEIDSYLPVIFRKLEWLDKEEIIKRFVSLQFNKFLEYYKKTSEIISPQHEEGDGRRSKKNRGNEKEERFREQFQGKKPGKERLRDNNTEFTTLFINIGKDEKANPKGLIELINKATPGKKIVLGRIELMRDYSLIEVDKNKATDLMNILNNRNYRGFEIESHLYKETKHQKKKKKNRT